MMTNEMGATDKLSVVLNEARAMGVDVLPPDVNEGRAYFWPAQSRSGALSALRRSPVAAAPPPLAIRFGLAAIKASAKRPSKASSRRARGAADSPASPISASAVGARTVSRKVLEALIRCGACDGFGETRATLFSQIDQTLARAASALQGPPARAELPFRPVGKKARRRKRRATAASPNGPSTNYSPPKRNCSAFTSPAIRSPPTRRCSNNTRCTIRLPPRNCPTAA